MVNFDSRSPSISCILVNGEKIRRIRQVRGFTQLYVATVLGVTTDTVSRWENNRSPRIKQENAEKLAEVLEVDISEICHADNKQPQKLPDKQDVTREKRDRTVFYFFRQRSGRRVLLLIISGLTLVLFVGRYVAETINPAPVADVTPIRILPSHVSPHQPFPVILAVDTKKDLSGSFILRESFPPSLSVKKSVPPFQGLNKNQGKWLAAGDTATHQFAYLATVTGKVEEGDQLHFSGNLLIGKKEFPVSGSTSVKVRNYHWADSNADYRIDDNEILTIYNYFELLQKLGVNLDEIKRIWAGNGYRWDQKNEKFILSRQGPTTGDQ